MRMQLGPSLPLLNFCTLWVFFPRLSRSRLAHDHIMQLPHQKATSDDPSCPESNQVKVSTGCAEAKHHRKESPMNSIIYIVGAIVIVVAILSFVGLA